MSQILPLIERQRQISRAPDREERVGVGRVVETERQARVISTLVECRTGERAAR